ncbi:MAG: 3-hydroxybutyrate dehydrogenase [Alphaproteobacteria bacterium]|nr:3-hydroxybutyrate dehydrogenase [Alphaproteobacteria bacterium]
MGETTRAVLITGSTSGIGLAIAKAFGAMGWRVGVNSYEPAAAVESILNAVADAGAPEVRYFEADLGDASASARIVEEAIAQFGALDVLVNNAGVQKVAPVEDFPIEDWNRIRTISLDGAFQAIRAVLPGMKQRQWGRIINIAAVHGLRGAPYKSAYVATKHALVGLTRAVALEVAELGITVNAICPGYVWTPLVERQLEEQMRQHGLGREEVIRTIMLAPQPTRRFVQPEEIGALAVYLCGDMARSITGTTIAVDGGWTAK